MEVVELQSHWFEDEPKRNKFIKHILSPFDFDLMDFENNIHSLCQKYNISSIPTFSYELKLTTMVENKFPYLIQLNDMPQVITLKNLNNVFDSRSSFDIIKFLLPKSQNDIMEAKRLLKARYESLSIVNKKLYWAKPNDYEYININFVPVQTKKYDIKMFCRVENITETFAISEQIYNILGQQKTDDYSLSNQFVNYVKSPNPSLSGNKSFIINAKSFDILNDLFFLFNRNDISMTDISFLYENGKNDISEYVKRFLEL